MMKRRIAATLTVLMLAALGVHATVELHPLFRDNAVLQRQVSLPVFGKADDGEDIAVTLAGKTLKTKAANGRWKVMFERMKAGGPYTLTVKGENTLSVRNVLIGDVWICTGQSNMATLLGNYVRKYPEILKGQPGNYSNADIRLVKFKIEAADTPQEEPTLDRDFETWKVCDPQSAPRFSATGYFFGKSLQPCVKVPIGLIQTCMGGTPAESWTPRETLEGNPAYKDILDSWQKTCKDYPENKVKWQARLAAWQKKNVPEGKTLRDVPAAVRRKMPRPPRGPNDVKRPSGLYNAMIASIHAYPIKGAIWYQGEANAHSYERAIQYRSLLPDMIKSWRRKWGLGDFPFFWVQLAPFKAVSETPQDTAWSWMRETMDRMQKNVPAGGMACIIDGGMQHDIHPPYKEFAGGRLALLARKVAYGEDVLASGPTFEKMAVSNGKVTLTFANTGTGLVKKGLVLDNGGITVSGDTLVGFTVCGKDRQFKNASAEITGKNTVEVRVGGVSDPVAVRYAWADFPLANLYNKEGLPTGPFRTDDFPPPETGE